MGSGGGEVKLVHLASCLRIYITRAANAAAYDAFTLIFYTTNVCSSSMRSQKSGGWDCDSWIDREPLFGTRFSVPHGLYISITYLFVLWFEDNCATRSARMRSVNVSLWDLRAGVRFNIAPWW